MLIEELVNENPRILTIAPTYKCTAKCKECCFRCTPQVEKVLKTDKILNYINKAVERFPTIELLVLTGGECFLISEDIPLIISRAKSKGLMSRIVSNGYWASSYNNAISKLTPIVKAGLTEVNFSTGDNHQEFVPFDNIINGLRAAYDLGIRSMALSIESRQDAEFTNKEVEKNIFLSPLIEKGILHILNAHWIKFSTERDWDELKDISFFKKHQTHVPCRNIFNNIFINPHSQMHSCCGLTVEYNEFLKLGNIESHSMSDLYHNQFKDLFKFWLHVDGPAVIYDKVTSLRNITKKTFNHECAYCIELVRDKENIQIIKQLFSSHLTEILYRYSLRKTKLSINL